MESQPVDIVRARAEIARTERQMHENHRKIVELAAFIPQLQEELSNRREEHQRLEKRIFVSAQKLQEVIAITALEDLPKDLPVQQVPQRKRHFLDHY